MKLLATGSAFVLALVVGFPIFQSLLSPNFTVAHGTLVAAFHTAFACAFAGLVYGVLSVIERRDGK